MLRGDPKKHFRFRRSFFTSNPSFPLPNSFMAGPDSNVHRLPGDFFPIPVRRQPEPTTNSNYNTKRGKSQAKLCRCPQKRTDFFLRKPSFFFSLCRRMNGKGKKRSQQPLRKSLSQNVFRLGEDRISFPESRAEGFSSARSSNNPCPYRFSRRSRHSSN